MHSCFKTGDGVASLLAVRLIRRPIQHHAFPTGTLIDTGGVNVACRRSCPTISPRPNVCSLRHLSAGCRDIVMAAAIPERTS